MKFGLPVTSKILKAKRVNTHVANVTNNGKIAIPIKSLSESNFVITFVCLFVGYKGNQIIDTTKFILVNNRLIGFQNLQVFY